MPLEDAKLLTCAYIILNKNVPTEEDPDFTQNFLITLFDSPQNTLIQPAPFGLQVLSPGKHSVRRFVFNPAKIQIVTESALGLIQAAGRVFEQLRKQTFTLEPSAYGLNYEFDFKAPEGQTAMSWLGKRFASPGLPGLPATAKVKLMSLDIVLEGVDNLRRFKLEPRTEVADRVFGYANFHFDEKRLLQGEQLEHAVTQGYEKCINLVTSLLRL